MGKTVDRSHLRRGALRHALPLLLAMLASPGHAAQVAPITLTDLAGHDIAFPAQLPAERTLVLVAFRHADQDVLAGWKQKLALTGAMDDWLEIPVIGVSMGPVKAMIRQGMRKRYQDAHDLAHVAPLFGDAGAHARMLDLSPQAVGVMVVARSGLILASVSGPVSDEAARRIAAAWHPADAKGAPHP